MTKKTYRVYMMFVGVICAYVIVRHIFFFSNSIPFRTNVIQGILVGFGLAIFSAFITSIIMSKKVNGWTTSTGYCVPGNGILRRAACVLAFPGPINIPQEAMYWTTSVDSTNRSLSGEHNYIMHFPDGGFPPNNAFWSLTIGDNKNHFVKNEINRYSLSDRSELILNTDGSIDIYIQNVAPSGSKSNWLPAPSGNFILWLRVYLPGEEVIEGKYNIPEVKEVE